ncbi:transposase [Vampirovibrio sp.]|uniref:transposase n=1 Tax=Vampirovibrio sp. TaxID=2717857 RepID=UPI00359441BA
MNNSSTHKTQDVLQWLDKHPRIHLRFTPTRVSWLNAVDGWFAKLERRALYRGVFTCVDELKAEIIRFVQVHNQNPKPFQWKKSAHDILKTKKKLTKLSTSCLK